jgi:hypothetical protein
LACLWLPLLSFASLKILSPQRGKLVLCIFLIVSSPVLAGLNLFAWFEHPERHQRLEGEAGMITHYSPVLTEPVALKGKELAQKTRINATPASPCRIIAVRGEWSYIVLANDVRGWILSDKVSPIQTATTSEATL